MGLSIRRRLTLWNTLALAAVLIGFSGLVYVLMRQALYGRVDKTLVSVYGELLDLEGKTQPDVSHWIQEAKEHQNIFCIVYSARGEVLDRTEELPSAGVPDLATLKGRPQAYADRTLPIIGRQRTFVTPFILKNQEVTVLLMGGLEDVDRELQELLAVLAVAVPAALIATGVLGYCLARKALDPMNRLHRQAEQITAEHLDRRLPVVNSDDELGRLTGTINAMIARLERSFIEMRRFTADASHELRTPLTAIRTEAEVALGKPLIPAEHQHLLGSILEECERLTRLTDQLLALSREDAGVARPDMKPAPLAELVSRVLDNLRPLAEAKGLNVIGVISNAATVPGDEARLRQVFYNLLDNAIKYTPPGGTIEVRVDHNGPDAVVVIRDTGIGIMPEHLPRVFDRFYRVDRARTRAEGGAGLGLSIAQSIVLAHRGKIELVSVPGRGTTCTVTIPRELNESQRGPAYYAGLEFPHL